MIARRILIGSLLALLLVPMMNTAHAQAGEILFGSFTSGELDTTTPAQFYEFTSSPGDLISIEALSLSGSLNPRVTLLSAASNSLATNSDDPFQPGSLDARLTYRIPEAGTYSILVEAENRTSGQYLLRLELLDPVQPQELSVGVVTTASLSPDIASQVYSFDSSQGTTITVTSPVRGFAFVTQVRGPDGQTIAVQSGNLLRQSSTTVAENTGVYTLVVRTTAVNVQGSLEVLFSNLDTAPPPLTTVNPDAETPPETSGEEMAEAPPETEDTTETEGTEPTSEGETSEGEEGEEGEGEGEGEEEGGTVGANVPDNRCVVIAPAGGVIIRQGPSTSFSQLSSIPGGDFRYADATDGVWIRLVGGGWVSTGVIETSGPCGGLPVISVPTSPQAAATAAAPTAEGPNVAPVGAR